MRRPPHTPVACVFAERAVSLVLGFLRQPTNTGLLRAANNDAVAEILSVILRPVLVPITIKICHRHRAPQAQVVV